MVIVAASLVGGHREVLTYLGSTYWSAEEVVQRQKAEFQRKVNDCKSEECRKRLQNEIWYLKYPSASELDDKQKTKETVKLFAILVFAVPAVLLLVLVAIFRLLAWAVAGFKTD